VFNAKAIGSEQTYTLNAECALEFRGGK